MLLERMQQVGEGAELACWRRGVGGQRGGKGEVEKEDKLNGQACRVTYHNFVQKGCWSVKHSEVH